MTRYTCSSLVLYACLTPTERGAVGGSMPLRREECRCGQDLGSWEAQFARWAGGLRSSSLRDGLIMILAITNYYQSDYCYCYHYYYYYDYYSYYYYRACTAFRLPGPVKLHLGLQAGRDGSPLRV